MKKLLLLLVFIFISIITFGQFKDITTTVPDSTTAFGWPLPAGATIKVLSSNMFYTITNKATALQSLSGGLPTTHIKTPNGGMGATGATGATGSTGVTGTAGAVWWQGSFPPSPMTGISGDFYLNTATDSVWEKIVGAWQKIAYIRGTNGATGVTGATGAGGGGGSSVMDSLNKGVFPINSLDTLIAKDAGFVDKSGVFDIIGAPNCYNDKHLKHPYISLKTGNPFNHYASSQNQYLSIQAYPGCTRGAGSGLIFTDNSQIDNYNADIFTGIDYGNGCLGINSNYNETTGWELDHGYSGHPAVYYEIGGKEGPSVHIGDSLFAWKNLDNQVFILDHWGGAKGAYTWNSKNFPQYGEYNKRWAQLETKTIIVATHHKSAYWTKDSSNCEVPFTIIQSVGDTAISSIDLFNASEGTVNGGAGIDCHSENGQWLNPKVTKKNDIVGFYNFWSNINNWVIPPYVNDSMPNWKKTASIDVIAVCKDRATLRFNSTDSLFEFNGLSNFTGLFKIPYGGKILFPKNTTGWFTLQINNDTARFVDVDYTNMGQLGSPYPDTTSLIGFGNQVGKYTLETINNQLVFLNQVHNTGKISDTAYVQVVAHQVGYYNPPYCPTCKYPVYYKNLDAWFRADSGLSMSGAYVQSWTSLVNHYVANATAYLTDTLNVVNNGKKFPAIHFTTSMLGINTPLPNDTGNYSLFLTVYDDNTILIGDLLESIYSPYALIEFDPGDYCPGCPSPGIEWSNSYGCPPCNTYWSTSAPKWEVYTFVHRNDSLAFYDNGIFQSKIYCTTGTFVTNFNIIGLGTGNVFHGKLYEMMMYNVALSPTDVMTNVTGMKSRTGITP